MRFYDCAAKYKHHNVFEKMSESDIRLLHLENTERRIPFYPVVTIPKAPIEMAFIALNAYCGDDYGEAILHPNFTEWCQGRYNSGTKLQEVLSYYAAVCRLSNLGQGSLYYTNFIKAVLPQEHFKKASSVKTALRVSPSLKLIFQTLLTEEIKLLSKSECKVFVGFGQDASSYFGETIAQNFGGLSNTRYPNIQEFHIEGVGVCYFVSEIHFSRYEKYETGTLALNLVECLTA